MKLAACLGLALVLGCGAAQAGEFRGSFRLLPNPADASTRILADDFFYADDANVVWKANKGNITDGASIPAELQALIGAPFDEDFIRAAVIHDHYCDKERRNRVRNWRSTHRVFYEMLRVAKVPLMKSKLMYYAVYTFGPKWGYLDQGDICGTNCINNIHPRYFEKLTYSFHNATDEEFMDVLAAVEADPDISLDALEKIGDAHHKSDESFDFRPYPETTD